MLASQAIVSVCDTGVGIPEEHISKIFERFYQTDNSSSFTLGTGIGLALAKGIMNMHHGKIDVESTVGKGSDFFVRLQTNNTYPNALRTDEPEEVEEEPEVNQETFAIFGVDSRENNLGKGTRSDSLMVVNVDNTNKKVYIASVYRDCYVQIEGHGLDKITHAHSFGGPELAMDTLNTNFDLDIQKYITVNFMNVAELVDDMDGIEQDITEEETKYINGYIDELNGIRGTSSAHITEAGTYTLDGTQAVAFSRIRYTEGGDYKRSERQRTVLFKIFSKAQELDKAKKIDIAKSMLDKINTNYLESEVLRLLSKITEYKVEAMDAFPKVFYSGKIDGVFYEVPVTLNDMSTQMHTFLYPTETYTPSETVQSISAQESAVAPTANNDFTQQ